MPTKLRHVFNCSKLYLQWVSKIFSISPLNVGPHNCFSRVVLRQYREAWLRWTQQNLEAVLPKTLAPKLPISGNFKVTSKR